MKSAAKVSSADSSASQPPSRKEDDTRRTSERASSALRLTTRVVRTLLICGALIPPLLVAVVDNLLQSEKAQSAATYLANSMEWHFNAASQAAPGKAPETEAVFAHFRQASVNDACEQERCAFIAANGKQSPWRSGLAVVSAPRVSASVPVRFQGQLLGEVRVERSVRNALILAFVLAAGGALAAAMIWQAGFITPMRSLQIFEGRWRSFARHDVLTGLLNREALRTRLSRALERGHSGVGVLLVDIDRFRTINDLFGQEAGDVLLCDVADRLRKIAPRADRVARLTADQFAIPVSGISGEASLGVLARNIQRAFQRQTETAPANRRATLSIGAALANEMDGESSTLLGQVRRSAAQS